MSRVRDRMFLKPGRDRGPFVILGGRACRGLAFKPPSQLTDNDETERLLSFVKVLSHSRRRSCGATRGQGGLACLSHSRVRAARRNPCRRTTATTRAKPRHYSLQSWLQPPNHDRTTHATLDTYDLRPVVS